MALATVLGTSVILLGIYIIAIYINDLAKPTPFEGFHLGCYLSNHSLSHSEQIQFQLQNIKLTAQTLRKKNQQVAQRQDIQDRNVNLAKKMQDYVSAVVKSKFKQKSQRELFWAIDGASKQYENCKQKISTQFSEQQCFGNWNAYEKCSSNLSQIKQSLIMLFNERKQADNIIKGLLTYNYTPQVKKNQTQQIQEKFLANIALIQGKQKKLKKQLEKLTQQRQTKSYLIVQSEISLNATYQKYKSCKETIKQYIHCKIITQQVQTLGFGSVEALSQKSIQKKQILNKLRKMLEGMDKSQGPVKQYFDKGVNELKTLLKIYIETSARISNKCGCSQQQLKQHQMNVNRQESQIQIVRNELKTLQQKIENIKKDLQKLKRQRQQLVNSYQQQISELTNRDIEDIDTTKILNLQKQKLDRINNNILQTQQTLKNLDFLCNQIKDNLNRRLELIDSAASCLSKKDYYLEIKKMGRIDSSQMIETENQKKIRKELKQMLEDL